MINQSASFTPVSKYPLDMTDDELSASFGGLQNSKLLRALIMAEVYAIRAGAERETRTMHGMWYDYIKPVLSRAGRLGDKTRNDKGVDWDGILSKYLAELVRDGLTSYAELLIVDGSRHRQVATAMTQTVYHVPIVGAHYPWLVLFTEKDTMWNVVSSLASLYGVSAISGGGEPSLACTENTVKAILKSERYSDGQPIVVLSLTDYDPSGYIIADAQAEQVRDVVGDGVTVRHERLGLEPGQLTAEERQAKAYTPKDKGFEEWFAKTGGVDGKRLGLELDALPMSRLRKIFAGGIESRIDLDARRDDLRAAFVDLLAWRVLKPEIDARLGKLRAAVEACKLGGEIAGTELPDELFRAAAVSGWDSIDPLTARYDGKPLFDCEDRVLAIMQGAR